MSGHSKWSTIKRKKGANDAKRGAMFTRMAREIQIAAREGADPEFNLRLRLAVDKAKTVNMPKDNIERAIRRGAGLEKGEDLEEITYEGYGPGGVALFIEVLTDNRNRTASDVRNAFSKFGGSMAEPGAVGWQFQRRGVILVPGSIDEDQIMAAALDAGASDIERDGESWRILTEPADVYEVQDALVAASIVVESAESTMVSSTTIEVTDSDDARQILRILDMLEENDDVQDVYANFDIDESLMREVG